MPPCSYRFERPFLFRKRKRSERSILITDKSHLGASNHALILFVSLFLCPESSILLYRGLQQYPCPPMGWERAFQVSSLELLVTEAVKHLNLRVEATSFHGIKSGRPVFSALLCARYNDTRGPCLKLPRRIPSVLLHFHLQFNALQRSQQW